MGEYERGTGDVADLAGAGGGVLEVRKRPVLSSANPRSPRQRRERSSALRVRVLISRARPSAGCLTGMCTPIGLFQVEEVQRRSRGTDARLVLPSGGSLLRVLAMSI